MASAIEVLNQQRSFEALTQANPAVADVTVSDLILDGRPMDARVISPDEVGMERRLDGASNLTMSLKDPAIGDPPRPRLLNSGIFAKAVDLDLTVRNVDDPVRRIVQTLTFRLADRAITDLSGVIGLGLTLEARAVARLRTFVGAKHASRNDKTRAEFIASLCDEAGIPFVCPDLHVKERIQTPEEAMTPAQRKAERVRDANLSGKGGTAKGKTAEVTVKGAAAKPEQIANMRIVSRVADAEKAPALAELAQHCAAIEESDYRALPPNRGGYRGVFQWQGSQSDTAGQARSFLRGGNGFQGGGAIALANAHPDWTPGHIALVVEGSISNFGNSLARGEAFYNAHRDEAVKIMQAFGASGSLDPAANTRSEPEPYAIEYMFKRLGADEAENGKDEDSWTCMRRLAGEVNWRLWEEAGSIYFMTDDRILRSAVEMTVEPMQDGVYSLTGKDSNRRDHQEVTIECDARLWQAGPATVVELYGWGDPMDGRWILSSIRRPSLWSPRTTITLQRREKALLEPSHELGQRAASTISTSASAVDALAAAQGIGGPLPAAKGTPKEIIDNIVLPIARSCGINVTPASVLAANNVHGPTVTGARSDHEGPPEIAWAADMPGSQPAMDRLATLLCNRFSIPQLDLTVRVSPANIHNRTVGGYRYQIIYRSLVGGDHTTHVHFGVRIVADTGDITKG